MVSRFPLFGYTIVSYTKSSILVINRGLPPNFQPGAILQLIPSPNLVPFVLNLILFLLRLVSVLVL